MPLGVPLWVHLGIPLGVPLGVLLGVPLGAFLGVPLTQSMRVHSSVVRAADCRSAGPWFKSGCALIIGKQLQNLDASFGCRDVSRSESFQRKSSLEGTECSRKALTGSIGSTESFHGGYGEFPYGGTVSFHKR